MEGLVKIRVRRIRRFFTVRGYGRAMYTHILSAIDDSECASNALARAIDVARWQEARLTIVHVVDPVKEITVAGSPGVALIERLSDEGRALLARAQARAAASGVCASTELQTGPTVEQIVSTSRRLGCDLIVLGSHGRSGLSRVLFGSVAEGVMRDASAPALIVHDHNGGATFRHILAPIDDSACAASALALAIEAAKERDATLTILNVVDPARAVPLAMDPYGTTFQPWMEAITHEANALLAKARQQAARSGVVAEAKLVVGFPVDEIVLLSTSLGCDLIVIGSHGRSGVSRLLLGSVAEGVTRRAAAPTLIVHEKAAKPAHAPSATASL